MAHSSQLMHRVFLFLSFIMYGGSLMAQKDSLQEKMVIDSLTRLNYVKTTRNYITVYVYSSRLSNGALYKGNSSLFYYPITPINIGIGASHKWLGGSVSIVSLQSSKSKFIDNYNFSIGVNAYGRRIGVDLSYTLNSGYYLSNYKTFVVKDNVDKSQPYTSMRMERVLFNFVYIFNGGKFSLAAPVSQGEVQKRSSSSFIVNMGVDLTFANNGDSSFVPSYAKALFDGNSILQQGKFYSFSFMPGYGATLVIRRRFFIGMVPSAGISLQYQDLNMERGSEQNVRMSYKVLGKFGIGYHAERWMVGVSLILDLERFPLGEGTALINNVGKIQARLGYKFNVPKWAKKYSRKMEEYQDQLEKSFPVY